MEVHHLAVLVYRQAEKYGDRVALKYRDYKKNLWIPISWNVFAKQVETTSCGLLALGVDTHENVGVFSQNKPECLFVEMGVYGVRAVSVPLYATSSAAQVQYIVDDASIRYLFVGEQYQYDAAFSIMSVCPSLEKLIIFDPSVKRDPRDVTSVYYQDFLAENLNTKAVAEVRKRNAEAVDTDLMNILYTSGTTGEPKGVLLEHKAFLAQVPPHRERLNTMSENDISMCFLPLTHVFEKAFTYLCLEIGCTVCINLKPMDIQTTMREVRPTVMCSVPRFWEKVYQGVMEKINESSGMKKGLMLHAIRIGREYNLDYIRLGKKPPIGLKMKYQFFERTVFSLLKKTVGVDRGNFFPTAGAAIPDVVNEFVHSVGINMIAGYGLTESMATVSCTLPVHYSIGSVGRLMPGVDLKFGENNEVLLKGDIITKGYYKKSDSTKEAFTEDGYFRTGDAGYLKDGELFLTDRIKDLFKTSNGKYIAPQQLETKLVVDRYIDQITIIADQRKFVSALIVPVFPAVKDYAARHTISYSSTNDLLRHPKIMDLFKARIDTLQQQFAYHEQVKRFTLLPRAFSMEEGELTNTLKIKRNVVAEHFAAEIDKMYEE